MKRLKYIINWTIWSVLILYVGVLFAIHIPFVQHFIGEKIANVVAEKMGTTVSVGSVDLGLLNRIIIDDVVIYDQSDSTMLRAGRLSVKVDLLPLLEGRVSISSAQLFGVHANLYKTDSLTAPNYQFALDALTSKDTLDNSPIDLRINSLIIRHSSLRYDRKDIAQTEDRINVNHLKINDISAHVILKTLTEDSLNINIKRLALKEQSGLHVERFSMRLTANHQGALLEDFHLQLPHSIFRIDTLTTTYNDNDWKTLRYATSINHTSITPSDLACFFPALRGFEQPLDIHAAISGTANSVEGRDLRIQSNQINLSAEMSVRQLDSVPQWQARIHSLDLTNGITANLKEAFEQIPIEAVRLGNLHISGEANGQGLQQVDSRSTLTTDAGHIDLTFAMTDGRQFRGNLKTDSISLRRIFDKEELGLLSTNVIINGNNQHISAQGLISRLDYKGYPYHNIQIDGTYQQNNMEGMLNVDDPYLQINLQGSVHRSHRTTIKVIGNIDHIHPNALNLTDQWGDADFAAHFNADFTASGLNDAEGTFDLTNFTMTQNDSLDTHYHFDHLHVESGYQEGIHFMKINGDMGQAELSGNFDWATLSQSFVNYTASKLPTLPGLSKTLSPTNNNFTAHLKLNDTRWMGHLLHIPLVLEQPVQLDIKMNDAQHLLDIEGQMPAFTYNDSRYSNGSITLTTDNNTTRSQTIVTKVMNNDQPLELQLLMQAADNQLSTSFLWDNKGNMEQEISGTINAITEVYTNDQGKPEAHVRIKPSQMILGGTPWYLAPSNILYSDQQVKVDYFNVSHGDQHLVIDGIASAQPNDTLMVDLNELEVAYILDMANFHSVKFDGLATGRAYITQPFDNVSAWADLSVKDFRFQEGRMGTLNVQAEWNKNEKQIDLHAVSADDEAQTIIDGYISPVRKDLDLFIEANNTNIEFCNSFTKSFLTNVKGTANGEVELSGLFKHVYLTGDLIVDGQATVKALNTTYWLQSDTIKLLPDLIHFQTCNIADREGHRGMVDGDLNHRNFKNFIYDLNITADHLLAYDFPTFEDGNTICGTVFATGHASIHGKPGEVVINCNVTPNRDSYFAYNAANPDAISQQDFITWGVSANAHKGSEHLSQTVLPTNDWAETTDIYLNFDINATPEAMLKVLMDQHTQDYITLNGTGNLKATYYNKGPFNMYGTYTINHGTYGITIQNIIKKNFTFQDGGTIVFGGDPFHAALNMQAVYTVNGVSLSDLNIGKSFSDNTVRVNCLMNIAGTPSSPRVDFDLEMPNVNSEEQQMIRSVITSEQEMNQQVLYLLGIGRFYTQGANNGQSQQYDQTSLAMQSFLSGTVSTHISELLSQVIKSNDWNFGANISTGNEGWHNAEYEGTISGRMLNNRLLINGQFGYRNNATQANPSFIGDFDIRYLLYPNGNLALKVYNQTNDRYFTRSSLNTQGVGLIMKRDFNGLGDLLRTTKKKKKTDKTAIKSEPSPKKQ